MDLDLHAWHSPHVQELLAIQQSDGPKAIGFFGTRNMGVTHQKLVEVLSYAYASTASYHSACHVAIPLHASLILLINMINYLYSDLHL